jgi:hypothetical protein
MVVWGLGILECLIKLCWPNKDGGCSTTKFSFCRVFKAKYFLGVTFMEAKLGHRPSYAWRSIALARNVLRMGLRWHIGDGRQVRIIDDPWLPVSQVLFVVSRLRMCWIRMSESHCESMMPLGHGIRIWFMSFFLPGKLR